MVILLMNLVKFCGTMQARYVASKSENTFGGINVGSFSPFFCLRSFSPSFSWPPIWSTHCSVNEQSYVTYAMSEQHFQKPHWGKKDPLFTLNTLTLYIWDSELNSNIVCFFFLKEIPQGRPLKFKVPHLGFEPWAGASWPVAFATALWAPWQHCLLLHVRHGQLPS